MSLLNPVPGFVVTESCARFYCCLEHRWDRGWQEPAAPGYRGQSGMSHLPHARRAYIFLSIRACCCQPRRTPRVRLPGLGASQDDEPVNCGNGMTPKSRAKRATNVSCTVIATMTIIRAVRE